jgi:hypothetical protein
MLDVVDYTSLFSTPLDLCATWVQPRHNLIA